MNSLEDRVTELERRVDELSGSRSGYVCVGCKRRQPANHYYYTARNSETKETVTPLCANCIRGALHSVMGFPWQHVGPLNQPVTA